MVYVNDRRKGTPILGQRDRAEKLVNWSIERVRAGTRYTEEFPCGLKLNFVAANTAPKMYIHWNPKRYQTFTRMLGSFERLVLSCWGIVVEFYKGETTVRLMGTRTSRKGAVVLWDTKLDFCKEQAGQDVDFLTGMIRFAEEGPVFLEEVACQQELEEASALAVIRLPKASSLPVQRLPKKFNPEVNLPANLTDLLSKEIGNVVV